MKTRPNLSDLYQHLGITPEGVAIIEAVRTGVPVRDQASGAQSSSGGFPSLKMMEMIGFESRTLELSYLTEIDADKDVFEIYDQPYHLRLETTRQDGKRCCYNHVPDFLVITAGWIAFVEVKPTHHLENKAIQQPNRFNHNADNSWSSPAAETALEGTGIKYRVVSDRDINPILVRNLSFLVDYRRAA